MSTARAPELHLLLATEAPPTRLETPRSPLCLSPHSLLSPSPLALALSQPRATPRAAAVRRRAPARPPATPRLTDAPRSSATSSSTSSPSHAPPDALERHPRRLLQPRSAEIAIAAPLAPAPPRARRPALHDPRELLHRFPFVSATFASSSRRFADDRNPPPPVTAADVPPAT